MDDPVETALAELLARAQEYGIAAVALVAAVVVLMYGIKFLRRGADSAGEGTHRGPVTGYTYHKHYRT